MHTNVGGGTVDLFEALTDGRIKALWVICTNPVASMANRAKVIAGLQNAEFVVVQDAFTGVETAAYADVVLPAALWSESEGVMINSERNLTLTAPLLRAPGQALPDWQLICRVAQQMGFVDGFDFPDAAAVFDEIAGFHNPEPGGTCAASTTRGCAADRCSGRLHRARPTATRFATSMTV